MSDPRFKKEKGFTLVELIVVVVIIGILVAIAVPVYKHMTTKANRASVEANLRTIDSAIVQYRAANKGSVPAAQGDISTYLQEWPTGPDGVIYQIDGGRGQANKGANTDSWFGTGPYKLPITTWP